MSWPLPQLPSGGPEAAREVAATCERLAAVLRSAASTVAATRQICGSNVGQTARAIDATLHLLQREQELTAGGLERSAQTMRRLADEIAAAQRRHHFSLRRMLIAGAILAGTGVALWVTAGGAAVIVVEAELAEAEAAVAAATAAGESAAAECSLLARAFAGIRGLSTVSRTQLAYGEVWLGAQSARSELLDGKLLPSTSPKALALDAAGLLAGAGAGRMATLALAGRTGVAATAATTTASAIGGAVPQTADDWHRTGSFPVRSFAWNAAKGAASSVISGEGKRLIKNFDKWKATHRPRPQPGRHRARPGRRRPASG